MAFFCIICVVVSAAQVILANESKILDYFDSDTFKTIQNHWQTERKSFENALLLILQQDYGSGGVNVYVRNMADSYKISDGFYFSDNVVHLILLETRLQMLPMIIAPDVTFALAANYLHIEARLRRMILDTTYILIRNQSDVVFTASEQDAYKKSPFSFQQVPDSGELTIIAQDCIVVGYTISSFSGNTINLGLDTFKLTNCKFSIEINSAGVGSPPVIGPYFSESQSRALETMLSNPIRAELMPKLQAAVFTYVNTSAIFGDKLPEIRFHQINIFKETSKYMSSIVGKFVENTIKKTQGILQLKPLEFSWNKNCADGTCGSCVRLKDVILYGLDTAYSAHIGGPFKLEAPKLAETIRFSTMQVRGKIYFGNATVSGQHDFSVELRDVAVNIEMAAKSSSFALVPTKTYVTGWRDIQFSILDMFILSHERRISQSFITGYLVNEIPKRLLDHISKAFGDIKNRNEQHLDKIESDKVVDESLSKENKKERQENNDRYIEKKSQQSDSSIREHENLSAREENSVEDEAQSGDVENRNEQRLDKTDSDKAIDESASKENKKQSEENNDNEKKINSQHSDSSDREDKNVSPGKESSVQNEAENVAQSLSQQSYNEI